MNFIIDSCGKQVDTFCRYIDLGICMSEGTVFKNNSTQAVRLPVDARFPEGVKHVDVRVVGAERVLTPKQNRWDSFFFDGPQVTDDFLNERADQQQSEREAF